jgi:hypothetical protein
MLLITQQKCWLYLSIFNPQKPTFPIAQQQTNSPSDYLSHEPRSSLSSPNSLTGVAGRLSHANKLTVPRSATY